MSFAISDTVVLIASWSLMQDPGMLKVIIWDQKWLNKALV